jgi:long-chain acyl-CoA synthetase
MTSPGMGMVGTVGMPIPGLEFRIAEDGEILTKGRHVFVGYFKDDASTQATLSDGWLHTGDLGEVDARGWVSIRGRKKEVLKTSGGKMIAPLPIEERLKEAPLIGQVCMVGDGRKYLSALITLSEGALAELKARSPTSLSNDVLNDPTTLAEVKKNVDQLNQELAQFEQIKRFAVIGREFSIADGEMTPTLKMKRSVIETRFKEVIDSMYTGGAGK